MSDASHPSPHAHRVGLLPLLAGAAGGPAAWMVQLVVNYGLASHSCYPAGVPVHALPAGWSGIWPALLGINLAAILLALAAAVISWRNWRETRQEHPGSSDDVLEAGEGRTRFVALCGVLAGVGFVGAVLFDTIVLFVVPPCIG